VTEHRITYADVFDREAPDHDEVLHAAAAVAPGDRVLDVGCGTGVSTRRAARAASSGRVLGVDVSAPLVEHARLLADREGLTHTEFVVADAQVHPFPAAGFDVVMSRFGVMFFADPPAAFANLARGLRPGGRLAVLVWQHQADNEWSVAVNDALGIDDDPAAQAWSLADPEVVRATLADFVDVDLVDVSAPMFWGDDAETAFGFITGLSTWQAALAGLDAVERAGVEGRLRDLIAAHLTTGGVHFGSRAWVVTAVRSGAGLSS
jgi:SAM-dependent methyltransferase